MTNSAHPEEVPSLGTVSKGAVPVYRHSLRGEGQGEVKSPYLILLSAPPIITVTGLSVLYSGGVGRRWPRRRKNQGCGITHLTLALSSKERELCKHTSS